ncbi:NAD(P)-dependent oxidoreductase [Kribbella sp. NPDC026611]|uniref:NAD(P)-dependent oxidoreductase n=1 Tax=Kribbella sp. NPDC026611 TaxID=3154911 RepID=UPI0033D211EA
MTDFWVHGLAGLDDNAPERLAARHPDWQFTDGPPTADAGYDVLVTGRPSHALLTASPRLRTLVVPFAGIPAETRALLADFPDLAVRTIHHNAGPTAELAVGLVLAAARAIVPADQAMRSGDWTPRFVPPNPTMILGDHRALVIGYGEVGRRVARGLAGLGMEVHAVRSSDRPALDGDVQIHPRSALAELVPRSRVVVLAVPASPSTDGLFNAALIAALPEPSVLVNMARATVVDEQALYERLSRGGVAAGLDVWWEEARSAGAATGIAASAYPFHTLPNVVLSPHRGGAFSLREVRDLRLSHVEAVLVRLSSPSAG